MKQNIIYEKMDKKQINWFALTAILLSIALEYYGVLKGNDIGIFAGGILAITNFGILLN